MIITVAGEHRAAHAPELGTLTVRIAVEDADAAAAMAALNREADRLTAEVDALRQAAPEPMTVHPVSIAVNTVRNTGSALLEPTGDAVSGRACVSLAQPDGVPPVVTSLR